MTKEEKTQYIDTLAQQLSESNNIYLTDTSELTVEQVNKLRRDCFKRGVSLKVVKNTILKKAMEKNTEINYGGLLDILSGPTSIMISGVANTPAKLIKEFRSKHDKPILKGAFIEQAIFIGDDQLSALSSLKSKEELIADVIALLQSPAKNVISGLKSSGSTIAGIVKTLQEK